MTDKKRKELKGKGQALNTRLAVHQHSFAEMHVSSSTWTKWCKAKNHQYSQIFRTTACKQFTTNHYKNHTHAKPFPSFVFTQPRYRWEHRVKARRKAEHNRATTWATLNCHSGQLEYIISQHLLHWKCRIHTYLKVEFHTCRKEAQMDATEIQYRGWTNASRQTRNHALIHCWKPDLF